MADVAQPLEWLSRVAADFDASVSIVDGDQASIAIAIRSVDGAKTEYDLTCVALGKEMSVGERVPVHLPSFCPERHIVQQGQFCLSWKPDTDLAIDDEAGARRWWAQLVVFLRLQRRAHKAQIWPDGAWAHGKAAWYQKLAEDSAARLGLGTALANGELEVRRLTRLGKRGDALHVLECRTAELCRFQGEPLRLVNTRTACVCPMGSVKHHRRFRTCGTHAVDAVVLANALLLWRSSEEAFWTSFNHLPCCGTMITCGLQPKKQAA